jgi:tetratricopeptide (TPR) repeat protein
MPLSENWQKRIISEISSQIFRLDFARSEKQCETFARGIVITLMIFCAVNLAALPGYSQGRWYNPAESRRKGEAILLYQKAVRAFQNEDYVNCINLLKESMHNDPANKDVFHLCALAMSKSGDNYNANMMFRSALLIDYNFVACRNNYGIFLSQTGKVDEAKKAFKECIKIDPKFAEPHYHLAQILEHQGDLDTAIEEYENAVRLNPKYFEAQRDLGLAIFKRATAGVNDIAESEDKLRTAAQLVPDNPMVHYDLATIYCADCRLDDAETEFRLALTYDPKLAAAHYELGKVRYLRGDLDRCLMEMQAALKVNPLYSQGKNYPVVDISKVKEYIAKCTEYKNQLPDSIAAWSEVAAMEHDNSAIVKHVNELKRQARANVKKKHPYDVEEAQALLTKGINQAEDGQLEAAKVTFDRVLTMNPESFEANQYIGAVREASGDWQGAMDEYKKALPLLPKFDGIYYNMAYLLEKMGLPADAGLMYQRFHEIAGRYPYDPKHIVNLQQADARERSRQQEIRQRGY